MLKDTMSQKTYLMLCASFKDFKEPRVKFKDLIANKLQLILYEGRNFLKIMEDQTVKFSNQYETL